MCALSVRWWRQTQMGESTDQSKFLRLTTGLSTPFGLVVADLYLTDFLTNHRSTLHAPFQLFCTSVQRISARAERFQLIDDQIVCRHLDPTPIAVFVDSLIAGFS